MLPCSQSQPLYCGILPPFHYFHSIFSFFNTCMYSLFLLFFLHFSSFLSPSTHRMPTYVIMISYHANHEITNNKEANKQRNNNWSFFLTLFGNQDGILQPSRPHHLIVFLRSPPNNTIFRNEYNQRIPQFGVAIRMLA